MLGFIFGSYKCQHNVLFEITFVHLFQLGANKTKDDIYYLEILGHIKYLMTIPISFLSVLCSVTKIPAPECPQSPPQSPSQESQNISHENPQGIMWQILNQAETSGFFSYQGNKIKENILICCMHARYLLISTPAP